MQIVLPEEALPATLKSNPELRMNDDESFAFCMTNADLWIERNAQGEILIVPPAGFETAYQAGEASAQLWAWARRDGRGKASGPTAEFILPTGAALSPVVTGVMSPSDRLKPAREKMEDQERMEDWMRARVDLGWLIHADEQSVYVYRAGRKNAEKRTNIATLAGEGPVVGFELDRTDIWAGL